MAGQYKLTKEGEDYLKNGLPEKNLVILLDSLPTKSAKLGKIVTRVKNFPIALKWALEKGWIMKKGDDLILLKSPAEIEEEVGLERVSKGRSVDEKTLNVLVGRNLVQRITETYKKTEESLIKSGNVIDELTHDIVLTGLWKGKKFKPINVEVVRKKMDKTKTAPGKKQPYNDFMMQVRKKLVQMGFIEMVGPMVETEFWNFDALFCPQNHTARDWASNYSLKYPKYGDIPKDIAKKVKAAHENGFKTGSTGWQYKWSAKKASQLMPRSHDTAITPRYMAKGVKIPGRYFNIARCYRPDVIDATHGVEFIHTGGIVVAKDLNFKHLLGLLKEFAYEVAGAKEVKFVSSYFPFTEPSCEIVIKHPHLGWVEGAGAGIFRPELTEPLGVKAPVIAWGFGIDRLAMHALKINDIRELFSRNLEWLRGQGD